MLEPEAGTWVYLARFGAAVFWGASPEVTASVLQDLARLPGTGARVEAARDDLRVRLGAEADRVGFSEVWLRELTLDKLKIISLALAQSVALDSVEAEVSQALAHLDSALFDQFDLEERLSAVNQKVAYLQDAGATVLDVLAHRKDQRLEWIIIVLILVEVVLFVWKEFPLR